MTGQLVKTRIFANNLHDILFNDDIVAALSNCVVGMSVINDSILRICYSQKCVYLILIHLYFSVL